VFPADLAELPELDNLFAQTALSKSPTNCGAAFVAQNVPGFW
jgi:hypothetical protein